VPSAGSELDRLLAAAPPDAPRAVLCDKPAAAKKRRRVTAPLPALPAAAAPAPAPHVVLSRLLVRQQSISQVSSPLPRLRRAPDSECAWRLRGTAAQPSSPTSTSLAARGRRGSRRAQSVPIADVEVAMRKIRTVRACVRVCAF
jgi:hypothetical protein